MKIITDKQLCDPVIKNYLNKDRTPDVNQTYFDKLAISNNKVYIQTCYEFYKDTTPVLRIISPIRERAQNILKDRDPVIGVQIRRGDNLEAIEMSPLELFIKKMHELLISSPELSFYISTDAEEVMVELKRIFNDKVFSGINERNRDKHSGIVAALIDFYCLSKTQRILGSFFSSFSEQAAKKGNIPLEVIRK